jgi:N-acyl-D-aspartate/D-glutamate deacylase
MRVVLIMSTQSGAYDLVIANGRVIDPASWTDAVRHIGIADGVIRAVSDRPLRGRKLIDAAGLVVCPGFIDLHAHGQDVENNRLQVMDGVTTALELEVGTGDVARWYAEREGQRLINYGASVGHIPARIKAMRDPGQFLPSGDAAHRPATDAEIEEMKRLIEVGLDEGAIAVGFGIDYTRGASRWEVLEMFRVAAQYGASCHVHIRGSGRREPMGAVEALEEVVAASAITGAPLHVVHVQSTGGGATPQVLQAIGEARTHGMDVTTECYPYTAGMTLIESALFDEGWREKFNIDYGDLMWAETGERLTARTFAQYREVGGMVILHSTPESAVRAAVTSPLTAIATDGYIRNGKGHPRTAGTYSRILGRFVREEQSLSLMDAIRKMTLMPAQRLERRVPAMVNKGRIRVGADADITVFDPERIIDNATYEEPTLPPDGVMHVLVNGVPVVEKGQLNEGIMPGRPVRATAA